MTTRTTKCIDNGIVAGREYNIRTLIKNHTCAGIKPSSCLSCHLIPATLWDGREVAIYLFELEHKKPGVWESSFHSADEEMLPCMTGALHSFPQCCVSALNLFIHRRGVRVYELLKLTQIIHTVHLRFFMPQIC